MRKTPFPVEAEQLPVPGVGEVLHLGLTCVRPEDRKNGLTHLLTKKAVAGYLIRFKPFGRQWVSNCAAVISSLGNVAMHFEDIYPSPFADLPSSQEYLHIARTIDGLYRRKIYISEESVFDAENFVFRGSVRGTCFQKEKTDLKYYHRNGDLTDYYKRLMDFDNGDEVLQIGWVSMLSAVRHGYRRVLARPELILPREEAA